MDNGVKQSASLKKKRGPGKPWQKGQSGNPHGRPPAGNAIAEMLKVIGDGPAPVDAVGELCYAYPMIDMTTINARQAVLLRCYRDAALGDAASRDFIANRTEGKIQDRIIITDNRIVVKADLPVESIPTGEVTGNEENNNNTSN